MEELAGNPNLRPETSTSQESGLHLDQGRFGAGVTLFRSEPKDMFDICNRTRDPAEAVGYPNYVGNWPTVGRCSPTRTSSACARRAWKPASRPTISMRPANPC